MMALMFGLYSSPLSEYPVSDAAQLSPGSGDLTREVAACRKRAAILLALTDQDLANAREWLDRLAFDDRRHGHRSSVR
jgi:hypothetical protein